MEKNSFLVNVDSSAVQEEYEKGKMPTETQQKVRFDVKNYLNLKLEKYETKKTIKVRLLPISLEDNKIFFSIRTHSLKVNTDVAKSGFKSYVCLSDPHIGTNDCPICKRVKELYNLADEKAKEGNDVLAKQYRKEAGSLRSKITYIVRVIDRDHEEDGVKFWRFNENSLNEGIYDMLMELDKTRKEESIADGKGDYSIFDLYNGKDIVINLTKTQIPDGYGGMKDKVSVKITDAGSQTPLSTDIDKANSWLSDPKSWKDVYSNKTADYISIVLDGGVPVFDREVGHFVPKVEKEEKDAIAEAEAASEILKDNTPVAKASDDDDLPF